MSNTPADLKYHSSHEWVRDEGNDLVTIGITDFAQNQLGDVVFVELPDIGTAVVAGESAAVVESVKAASDVNSPVSGTVVAVNESLESAPEQVNEDPYEDGWFFQVKLNDSGELKDLMDAESYQDQCAED
ncbi:glycine cleavage system protein GcvH [Saccharospirillum mangrovi]|uniref:glycine cleavage system protein GcvH n=1 Tax=Saccharospirillum mangrovi TaxID=2161747 RepID=UPI000D33C66E|nr:glycine cleavage system protein GcvH [Saccharospirillum mangrovi]